MKDIYQEPNMEMFSKRLCNLRQIKGQTARDMSLSLGQSHNYINGIETMRNFPTMSNFFYMCEYLGITPKDFFDYEDEQPGQSSEILAEIKKLDGKSKEYILGLIKDINSRPK